jgi:hypothetical protein
VKKAPEKSRECGGARVQFLFLTKEGLFPIMTLSSHAPPLLLAEDPTHTRRRVDFSEIQFLAISLPGFSLPRREIIKARAEFV